MREPATLDLSELLATDDLTPEVLAQAAALVHAAVRRKDDTAVRSLGEQLDRRGGFALMQAVHRQLTGRLRHSARGVEAGRGWGQQLAAEVVTTRREASATRCIDESERQSKRRCLTRGSLEPICCGRAGRPARRAFVLATISPSEPRVSGTAWLARQRAIAMNPACRR